MTGAREALHNLLEDAARAAPDNPAVIYKDRSGRWATWTYRELRDQMSRAADALIVAGAAPNDRVIVDAENSPGAIAMLMACSAVGAAFIPVSPEVPDERLQKIAELSRPHAYAFATEAPRLDAITTIQFPTGSGEPRIHRRVTRSSATTVAERPLAYLAYTSGSTGTPKGVAMPQQATYAFFAATRGMLRPDDRVASTAPLQFDFCLLDIGMCLANRAAVVPVPRSELRWPRRLVATLQQAQATRVHAVPSVWRPLLRHEPRRVESLTGVTAVMYSGEPFPRPELTALRSALPRARLINCYGPTECMACSFTDITNTVDRGGAGLPIDGAYPGSSIAIVDEDGRPIDVPGRVGEILFRGPSIFAGYWADGAGPVPAAGVGVDAAGRPTLLTGDFAHWGDDRRLYLDGRRDRQVKVDGNRVELTEIESTLGSVDGVEQVRVVALPEDGRIGLTAFVAAPDQTGEREAAYRRRCSERLPSYMQPSRIVHLRHLPLTVNGKVDQARLVQLAAR